MVTVPGPPRKASVSATSACANRSSALATSLAAAAPAVSCPYTSGVQPLPWRMRSVTRSRTLSGATSASSSANVPSGSGRAPLVRPDPLGEALADAVQQLGGGRRAERTADVAVVVHGADREREVRPAVA